MTAFLGKADDSFSQCSDEGPVGPEDSRAQRPSGYQAALGTFRLKDLQTPTMLGRSVTEDSKHSALLDDWLVEVVHDGVPGGSDCDTGHKMVMHQSINNAMSCVICYKSDEEEDGYDLDPSERKTWGILTSRVKTTSQVTTEAHGLLESLESAILNVLPLLQTMTPQLNELVLTGEDTQNRMVLERFFQES